MYVSRSDATRLALNPDKETFNIKAQEQQEGKRKAEEQAAIAQKRVAILSENYSKQQADNQQLEDQLKNKVPCICPVFLCLNSAKSFDRP